MSSAFTHLGGPLVVVKKYTLQDPEIIPLNKKEIFLRHRTATSFFYVYYTTCVPTKWVNVVTGPLTTLQIVVAPKHKACV